MPSYLKFTDKNGKVVFDTRGKEHTWVDKEANEDGTVFVPHPDDFEIPNLDLNDDKPGDKD